MQGPPADIEMLADEMSEDPRCEMVLAGFDAQGAILVSIWDPTSVDEVEEGLKTAFGSEVRRVQMVDPRANL